MSCGLLDVQVGVQIWNPGLEKGECSRGGHASERQAEQWGGTHVASAELSSRVTGTRAATSQAGKARHRKELTRPRPHAEVLASCQAVPGSLGAHLHQSTQSPFKVITAPLTDGEAAVQ